MRIRFCGLSGMRCNLPTMRTPSLDFGSRSSMVLCQPSIAYCTLMSASDGCLPSTGMKTMRTVTLEEAQARLPEIIDNLVSGEELLITRNNQPVAKLVGQQQPVRKPRRPGRAKGKLVTLAEDDEHLQDFAEYMQ